MPVSVDPTVNVYPIDADLYMEMVGSGLLEGRPVELIDGVLVEMSPPSPEHTRAVALLGRHFVLGLAGDREYLSSQQGNFEADGRSRPEPDLIIWRETGFDVANRRPISEVVFVGEVSLSSLRWDLGRKRLLYAAAGIREYWALDVEGERLLVHRDPVGGDYRTVTAYRRGEPVAPAHLPVPALDIADVLYPI